MPNFTQYLKGHERIHGVPAFNHRNERALGTQLQNYRLANLTNSFKTARF